MRIFWTSSGTVLALVAVGTLLSACSGPEPASPDEPAPEPAAEPAQTDTETEPAVTGDEGASPEAFLEIDIGDVTYGVYTVIEIREEDVQPNFEVTRLSSPRFDHRTQLLTINIAPPYPDSLPLTMWFGSTRFLMGHSVIMKIHAFREYTNSEGEEVVEEFLTLDRVLGYERLVRVPEFIPFDPFVGLEELPDSMLVYTELEAWLFLGTHPDTLDPATADLESADYKRYPGFNPARINLVGSESSE